LGVLLLILCGLTFAPNTALAHGEKALEPFIRMRTIQWYDVMWSKDTLNVNDEVVITGKFHVAEDWPRGVPKPDAAYLNVSSPGPVFVRTERYLNGEASVSSAALKLGGDYDFKIVLKARLPGRYHLHPFFNLHDAGAVMGPGHWFEVAGECLFPSHRRQGSHVPYKSLIELRAVYMPDAAWAVSGHPPS